ncbi:hypothetical protein GF352_03120 [archaeon]|nr:hypothetical protein [archaeon]
MEDIRLLGDKLEKSSKVFQQAVDDLNTELSEKIESLREEYGIRKKKLRQESEKEERVLKNDFIDKVSGLAEKVLSDLLDKFRMTEDRSSFNPLSFDAFKELKGIVTAYSDFVPEKVYEAVMKVEGEGADYTSIYLNLVS